MGRGDDDQVPLGCRDGCGKPGLSLPPRAYSLHLLPRLLRSRSFDGVVSCVSVSRSR